MRTITIDELMTWRPCYSREKVMAVAKGHSEMTALEVLRLDISIPDRLWVVLREEVLGDKTLMLFVCACAEHVLPIYEAEYPDDMRPRNAIETARLYTIGDVTKEELEATAHAARDAARTTAQAAASAAACAAACAAAGNAAYTAAAYAAACAAAGNAAWVAAWDAAYAAAYAAACAAAWNAARTAADATRTSERQWQVDTLIAMLEEGK